MTTPSLFVVSIERYVFFPDIIVQLICTIVFFAIFNWKYGWFNWTSLVRTLRHPEIS